MTKATQSDQMLLDSCGVIFPGTFTALIGIITSTRTHSFGLGPSGSGKTTLLNMISCYNRKPGLSTSGELSFLAEPVNTVQFYKRNCGFVEQNTAFLPNLTVQETLEFYAELGFSQ